MGTGPRSQPIIIRISESSRASKIFDGGLLILASSVCIHTNFSHINCQSVTVLLLAISVTDFGIVI